MEALGAFIMQLWGSGTLQWLKRAIDIKNTKKMYFDEIHPIFRLVLTPQTAPEWPKLAISKS